MKVSVFAAGALSAKERAPRISNGAANCAEACNGNFSG
jgi:hypothetical protein